MAVDLLLLDLGARVVARVYARAPWFGPLAARSLLGLPDAEGSAGRARSRASERARRGRTVRRGARAGPGPEPACRVRAIAAGADRSRGQARRADPCRAGGRGG